MKVIVCAGDKTEHIDKYLKAKSSMSIEPVSSVLDVISRIDSGGFIADKVVVFGFALDEVNEGRDLDDVFESLSKIASDAVDNKELLIVNRGARNRNYDRYFFKYMQGMSHARFDRSPELVMRDLERIISGSSGEKSETAPSLPSKRKSEDVVVTGKSKEKKPAFGGLFGKGKKGIQLDDGKQEKEKQSQTSLKADRAMSQMQMPKARQPEQEHPVPVNEGVLPSETAPKISFGETEFDSVSSNDQSLGISLDEEFISSEEESLAEFGAEPFVGEVRGEEPEPATPAREKEAEPVMPAREEEAEPAKPEKQQKPVKIQPAKKQVEKKGFGLGLFGSKGKKQEVGEEKRPLPASEAKKKSKPATTKTRFVPDEVKIAEMQKRSKIVLVTGNNRAGKSSMVANLAFVAQAVGVRTLVLDMDMRGRGMSILFPQEINPEENYYTNAISNALRSPYAYTDFVWEISDNLDILGMDISVGDIAMHEEVADNAKLSELLAVVRTQYDLVLIDMPVSKVKQFGCSISLSDRIAFVTENDVSSLVNIINNLGLDMFSTVVDFQMFRSKCGFIINRYNPTCTLSENVIDPQNLTLFLDRISEDVEFSGFPVYGAVEDVVGFSKQMDGGHLICESSGFDRLFFDMLYCLYR